MPHVLAGDDLCYGSQHAEGCRVGINHFIFRIQHQNTHLHLHKKHSACRWRQIEKIIMEQTGSQRKTGHRKVEGCQVDARNGAVAHSEQKVGDDRRQDADADPDRLPWVAAGAPDDRDHQDNKRVRFSLVVNSKSNSRSGQNFQLEQLIEWEVAFQRMGASNACPGQ